MGSMIGSGIITFLAGCASAIVFFLMLGLALNGYMGQQRAVNASFGTYAVLAGLTVLAATALSVFVTRILQRRFSWNAVLAVLLSSISFSVVAGGLHFVCVIVAAIVADSLRTGK
jgi:hypothetical protein